jgi:hypothetical protein
MKKINSGGEASDAEEDVIDPTAVIGPAKLSPKYEVEVRATVTSELKKAFARHEVIRFRHRFWFVEDILEEGIRLISIDRKVYQWLEAHEEARIRAINVLRKPNSFFCPICGGRRPLSKQFYGRRKTFSLDEIACTDCADALKMIPYQDKWADVKAMMQKKGTR